MKVLIIGGTGLISTAIARQLLARGDEVTLYNRGRTPSRVPTGALTIRGDRHDRQRFGEQIRDLPELDAVIDMICYRPDDAQQDLDVFAGRARQLVFCSTVDVYSRPASRYPYREDETFGPLSEYAAGKVACERLFAEAHTRGDLPVTILRPAHTYGEGGAIIHSLGWSTRYIDRMRKGRPIIVHGDGQSLWVSCHVEDVARAFVGALGNERALGRAYHVTGDEWRTWNRYHEQVAEALGVPLPELVHIPTDLLVRAAPREAGICGPNFQYTTIFDTAAARADLGFRATVPWVEGVRRTVEWLDANGRIEASSDDDIDDRIIAAWRRLSSALVEEVAAEG
ncbi:MAG TPA: NAD-dependent epimerase/dehydratase family protein [Chthonomonadales bacterium]|nr:NAD-dependent epimerase/dehydratase family protein [Chthonomonadales bacterium]